MSGYSNYYQRKTVRSINTMKSTTRRNSYFGSTNVNLLWMRKAKYSTGIEESGMERRCMSLLNSRKNPLYAQIILPRAAEDLFEELEDIDAQFSIEETTEARAIVTQMDVNDSFYEHLTIHPILERRPNEDATTLYQMFKIMADNIDPELELDHKCFPDLFCYGKNGQNAIRETKLTAAEFVKTKLISTNSRFRLNVQYLFFLLNEANIRQMKSGIYSKMFITNKTKNLNAEQICKTGN